MFDKVTPPAAIPPAVMPDGSPAPTLLTEDEAIRFLRLDGVGNAKTTLRHYRTTAKLNCTTIGRLRLYSAAELLRFIDRQTGVKRRGENGAVAEGVGR